MESARQIVESLLEADEPFDPRAYLQASYKADEVNVDTAQTANHFYHRTLKYAKSNRPIEVRRMGRTKLWKRQPDKFKVPVKFGMYDSFYIDNDNAHEWATAPQP